MIKIPKYFLARLLGGLMLGWALTGPVGAAEVTGMYESTVPVADQTAKTRRVAVMTAMREVVVRVTGNTATGSSPAMRPVIQGADRLIEQYRYQTTTVANSNGGETELKLWVRFDAATLNSRIRAAGFPVWGKVRPAALLWVAIESETDQYLLSAEEHPALKDVIASQAQRRGATVILPLLDLEDRSQVLFSDVRAGFIDAVQKASQRYATDALVTGGIAQVLPGIWEGRWTFITDGRETTWRSDGVSVEAVLEEAVDEIADMLAAHYAPAGDIHQNSYTELTVAGVNTIADYARSLGYLQGLEQVLKVHVARLSADTVVFQLQVRGSALDIDQAIALGRTLVPDNTGDDMRYQLLP